MKPTNLILAGLITLCIVAAGSAAGIAKPFVWARAGDALTLDPHAVNEGSTHALNHQIYEPLLIRDRTGKLEPALASRVEPNDQSAGLVLPTAQPHHLPRRPAAHG